MTVVEHIVALCCRFPKAVIVACLLLTGLAVWYTDLNFAMNTDSEQLIDAKVGWRMRQARFDAAFPQQSNLTVAVIDGVTPELAESAAARLTEKLAADSKMFSHVRRPDGGVLAAVALLGGMSVVRILQGLLFAALFPGHSIDAGTRDAKGSGPVEAGILIVLAVLLYATAVQQALADQDPDAPPPHWIATAQSMSAPRMPSSRE